MYGGFGAAQPTFAEAISAAQSALNSLRIRATALKVAATDTGTQGLAEQAQKFSTDKTVAGDPAWGRGWRLIRLAQQQQKSTKLIAVQEAVKNMNAALGGELGTAVINRFISLAIPLVGPAAALAPAEVREAVAEEMRQADLPGEPGGLKNMELYIKIGLGLGALVAVAYIVRAFR